jgi:hypothetical protein
MFRSNDEKQKTLTYDPTQLFPRKTVKKSTLNCFFEERNPFQLLCQKAAAADSRSKIQIHHNDQNYC